MKLKFTIIFLTITSFSFSQGVNNLWLMGYLGGRIDHCCGGGMSLDFKGGSLTITQDTLRKMSFNETNGVICDKQGNLLFSSNGIWIANADNDTMMNGSGLNPGAAVIAKENFGLPLPQGNLIIPVPSDTTKYYLFHETSDDWGKTYVTLFLYYSVIDMSGDGGKGVVTQKNIIMLSDSLVEGRLTACKHANGRDWWLIAHQYNTNKYYKFLITPNGINGPYIQNIGAIRDVLFGQCVFSPDGKLFAYYEPYVGDLDIFDFDRCTGDFSPKVHVDINDSASGGGVAFSPNSQVLYVSSMNYVYQFDMTATNIAASIKTVAVYDGYYSPKPPFASSFFLSQLAPDGKIYINCGNGTLDIHVINNPDIIGAGCDVCQHCIHLPAYNGFTIPNHPNYFLGAEAGSPCDTITSVVSRESSVVSQLQLFPNPVASSGAVTFTYASSGEEKTISIINIEGKEVALYSLPQWSSIQHLKLPELPMGIYMARLTAICTNGTQAVSVKFVVE